VKNFSGQSMVWTLEKAVTQIIPLFVWAFLRHLVVWLLTESTPAPTMLLTKLKTSLGIVAVPSGVAVAAPSPPLSSSAVVLDVEDRNADAPPVVRATPPPRGIVVATIKERADAGADANER
jgi:hypothetical protein